MDRSGGGGGGGGGGEGRCLWKIIKIENSMISTLPDDLLKEILIRLPDLKSLIRCGLVCKRWWSSTVSLPDFVAGFMEHHRSKVPPLRLVLRDNFIHGNTIHINLPLRLSLYPPLATVADSFPSLKRFLVPDSWDLIAASRDLLLFTVFSSYYVCNPLTGQRFRLPGPPRMSGHLARSGLVSEPNNNNNNRRVGSFSRYRVMLMYYSSNTTTHTTIFCSETGQWIRVREYPGFVSLGNGDVVAGNDGVLYLIHSGLEGLIALDPFKAVDGAKALRFIQLPGRFLNGIRGQLRVGLFQGRPRLSQLSRVDSRHLCLNVWDLIYDGDGDGDDGGGGANVSTSWPLVHKVEFEAVDVEWMSVFVLAFHPSDSDQIFMLRNRNVYQVNLETKTQVKIAEIHSYYKGKMPDLSIFPYAHPEWPTLI
ncbi:F-box domain containing protein [Parasponia andersonii]|uniref:F-box domain containing protein n=1 Tax=Parasponia andersonii TaxID=3476 RepID=A0A2P5D845_PARAD|nr:F-box domain containing protein [Parasponia andersonii]